MSAHYYYDGYTSGEADIRGDWTPPRVPKLRFEAGTKTHAGNYSRTNTDSSIGNGDVLLHSSTRGHSPPGGTSTIIPNVLPSLPEPKYYVTNVDQLQHDCNANANVNAKTNGVQRRASTATLSSTRRKSKHQHSVDDVTQIDGAAEPKKKRSLLTDNFAVHWFQDRRAQIKRKHMMKKCPKPNTGRRIAID